MSNSLSEVFGTEADLQISEEVEPAAAEATPEQSADDVTGSPDVEASTEDKAAIPAEETKPEIDQVEALTKQVNAFKAKALDEVSKRQALENQMQAAQQQEEAPDAFVEPDAAIQHAVNQVQQRNDDRFLNFSEEVTRKNHEDYDEIKEVFLEMANENPLLAQQAMAQPMPHEWLYQQAKTHNEFKDISSVDDLRAKIEAETRAKIEAEYAEKQKTVTEKAITDAIPNSLASSTAAGGNTTPIVGQAPLDKIFG